MVSATFSIPSHTQKKTQKEKIKQQALELRRTKCGIGSEKRTWGVDDDVGRVASDPSRGGPNVVHGCETERKRESLCWNPKSIRFIYSADECGGYFLFGVQKFPSRFCWFLGRKDNNGVFISNCPFHISRVWFSGSGIPFCHSGPQVFHL